MDKIKQLIGSARYKLASDLDYKYTLNLNNDGALIKNNFNKIIYTINQEQVFREERLKSTKYRILGKLNILTDNDLGFGPRPNDTKPTSKQWSPEFNGDISSKTNPNNWVLQILYPSGMDKYNYVGKNQAYRGISVVNLVEGVDERTTITTQQRHGLVVDNFCYIYSLDSNNNVYTGIHKVEFLDSDPNKIRLDFNYQQPNSDNLLIKKIVNPSKKDINFEDSKKPIEVEHSNINGAVVSSSNPNANYIKITTGNLTPALINDTHNLNVGDYIEIRVNDTNYGLNGLHRVEKTINRYQFLIDLKLDTQLPNNVDINYRRLDGIPSDYYIRNFTLLTRNDYDVVKATSFGRNIYPETSLNQLGIANQMWLFNFTEDVDVNELYSHRGGQTTQLYFATIKTSGNNPYPWTDVTAHWDFNKTTANSTNGEELICKYDYGTQPNGSDGYGRVQKNSRRSSRYIGDFVEYNRYQLIENTLSDIIHRWSVINNETNGYYIQPFQKLEIRKFSDIIEKTTNAQKTLGIPGDAEVRPNGDVIWRDILEPGYIENGDNGVDFPFLNGSSYIYLNKNIFIRKQTPDPLTDEIDNEDTEVSPIKVC